MAAVVGGVDWASRLSTLTVLALDILLVSRSATPSATIASVFRIRDERPRKDHA